MIIYIFGFTQITKAEQLLFDVKPVFPDNQDPAINHYLALDVEGEFLEQMVEFILVNLTDEEVIVQIEALNALNSPYFGIQYTREMGNENSRVLTEQYALGNFIEVEEEVILAGGETKRIDVRIDVPDGDGTLLGAIVFKTLSEEASDARGQLTFNQELNRIIGVQINRGQTGLAAFSAGVPYIEKLGAYYAIRLPLELRSPTLVTHATLVYEVLDEAGEVLFEAETHAFNVAPKTGTDFLLPWNYETLVEGEAYRINGLLAFDDQEFSFSQAFEYEEDAVGSQDQGSDWVVMEPRVIKRSSYSWVVIIIIGVALGGGSFIYLKRRKMGHDRS